MIPITKQITINDETGIIGSNELAMLGYEIYFGVKRLNRRPAVHISIEENETQFNITIHKGQ